MGVSTIRRAAVVVVLALMIAAPSWAQSTPTKLQGIIHANVNPGTLWVISGDCQLTFKGNSGKADFIASLAMSQSGVAPGAPHTHHVSLSDATVSEVAGGYSITGTAAITGNGSLANALNGSTVTVAVTGGPDVPLSNITITFAGGAAGHFGAGPVSGVVVYR